MVVPAGFVRDEALGAPDLSQSPRAHVASWEAWRSADGRAALAFACFDVAAASWAPEADELAQAKLHETIAGTATRAVGFGDLSVTRSLREREATLRTYHGAGAAELDARSVQGFVTAADGPTLSSCFALCADTAAPSRCADAVHGAAFRDDHVAAPAPGLALGALTLLVRHPSATAWGGATLLLLAGTLAILTRKRPKRRRLR